MKRIIFTQLQPRSNLKWILSFLKKNMTICILTLSLIIGIVIGSISAKNADGQMFLSLDLVFNNNISFESGRPIIERFIASMSVYFVFVMILFLMGMSVWGIIAVPFIVFFRGFGAGLSFGYLCMKYGIVGFAYNVFVLLPGVFLSSVAILIMAKESINFSLNVIFKIFPSLPEKITGKVVTMKTFVVRSSIVLIIILVAALLDILCTNSFADFFNFT